MKHISLLFITFLFTLNTTAQTVKVVDENKAPLPYACVKIYGHDESVSAVIFTDRNGLTPLPSFEPGSLLRVDAMGYQSAFDTLITQKTYHIQLTPSTEHLADIVITGQYSQSRAEAAVHEVRIIDQKRIERLGANDVSEVLSRELNIRVSQDNILGSGIEMQGVSGQNVKVLIDGVPMVGRLDGNIDLSQVPANSIERIEIINGPLSVQYGTDALGGTINIITVKADTTSTIQLAQYYESVGQYNSHINGNWGNQKHALNLHLTRQYFDGWTEGEAPFTYISEVQSDSSRFESWKPKEQYSARLNYDYRYSEKLDIGIGIAGFSEEMINRGYPRGAYEENAFDDIYRTTRGDVNARFAYTPSSANTFNALIANNYFRRSKNTYARDLTTLESTLTPNQADQDTTLFNTIMSRGSWIHQPDSSHLPYSVGYDINHESTRGKRIEDGTQSMTNAAIFADAEWSPFTLLTIRPGLRVGYNSSFKIPLIPSLQVRWGKTEDVLRFSYARGFRSPSLKEMYFNFVDINHDIHGNPNLSPEDGHNLRLQYTHSTSITGGRLNVSASTYYNYINQMITLAQNGSATLYSYVNVGTFESIGFNLQSSIVYKRLRGEIGLSNIARSSTLTDTYNLDLQWSPEVQMSATYSIPKWKTQLSAFYKYNGVRLGYALDTEEQVYQTEIEAYQTLDISITSHFFNDKWTCTIGAKNLFDVTQLNNTSAGSAHSSGSSIPQNWGRSYFIRLQYTLGK